MEDNSSPNESNKLDQLAEKRTRIVKELFETEKSYISFMKCLIEDIQYPLKQKKLLPDEEFKRIFLHLEVLVNFGKLFVSQLQSKVETWDPNATLLSDIFNDLSKYLKGYTNYVTTFADANQTAKRLMQESKEFSSFMKTQLALPQFKLLDFEDLLIMPIQRATKYSLLIGDLVKHTWPEHPDYNHLVESLAKINDMVDYLNKKKKDSEKAMEVSNIIRSIHGLENKEALLSPVRAFVKQGELMQYSPLDKITKTYYIFLFNDLIIWTKHKKNSNTFEYKKMFYLADLTLLPSNYESKPSLVVTLPKGEKIELFHSDEHVFAQWANEIMKNQFEMTKKDEQAPYAEKRKTFLFQEEASSNQRKPATSKEIFSKFKKLGTSDSLKSQTSPHSAETLSTPSAVSIKPVNRIRSKTEKKNPPKPELDPEKYIEEIIRLQLRASQTIEVGITATQAPINEESSQQSTPSQEMQIETNVQNSQEVQPNVPNVSAIQNSAPSQGVASKPNQPIKRTFSAKIISKSNTQPLKTIQVSQPLNKPSVANTQSSKSSTQTFQAKTRLSQNEAINSKQPIKPTQISQPLNKPTSVATAQPSTQISQPTTKPDARLSQKLQSNASQQSTPSQEVQIETNVQNSQEVQSNVPNVSTIQNSAPSQSSDSPTALKNSTPVKSFPISKLNQSNAQSSKTTQIHKSNATTAQPLTKPGVTNATSKQISQSSNKSNPIPSRSTEKSQNEVTPLSPINRPRKTTFDVGTSQTSSHPKLPSSIVRPQKSLPPVPAQQKNI